VIDLYYARSPNAIKVTIALGEMGLQYRRIDHDVPRGDTHTPSFLEICPNGKIPAIVDHAPSDGGSPLPLWESGAILIYLADKTNLFLSKEPRSRARTIQWLMWQMAGLGPMLGQAGHFLHYSAERVPYGISRYVGETQRLYGVLDRHLTGRTFIDDDYSIADMACWPWIYLHQIHMVSLDDFPNVARWFHNIAARPIVEAASAGVPNAPRVLDDAQREILFPSWSEDKSKTVGSTA